MRIALVDDESSSLLEIERLCRLFGAWKDIQMEIQPFSGGEEFLDALEDGAFSLVFMDIYMRGLTGVEAARRMRKTDPGCLLVFLTSSRDHMPDAFSCHAFEYITKPVAQERVFAVLEDALELLRPTAQYVEFISERRRVRLSVNGIVSVVSDAHYLLVTMRDGSVTRCRMKLSEFAALVEGNPRFILVNKGILLNADYILRFEDRCCMMKGGGKFPIRVRDRLAIEEAIRAYAFQTIRDMPWN